MTAEIGTLRTEEPASALPVARPQVATWSPTRVAVIAGLTLVIVFVVPLVLDSYWMLVMTGAVIYSIVTLGLNVLIGRVGMVSLCQFVLAAVGAWVALRLSYGTSMPFPLLLLAAGLVTGVIGVLIGLPALRLSGLHLALITLMAAGAITIILRTTLFPNGGGGLFGNSAAGGASSRMPRPSIAQSDTAYYRFCALVAALMFVVRRVARAAQAGSGVGGDPSEPGRPPSPPASTPCCTSCGRSPWRRSWPELPARCWRLPPGE